jgi:hypothetical protein
LTVPETGFFPKILELGPALSHRNQKLYFHLGILANIVAETGLLIFALVS